MSYPRVTAVHPVSAIEGGRIVVDGVELTNDLKAEEILQVSRYPAEPPAAAGLCLIQRGHNPYTQRCPADYCINSMADLVAQHQLSLRS